MVIEERHRKLSAQGRIQSGGDQNAGTGSDPRRLDDRDERTHREVAEKRDGVGGRQADQPAEQGLHLGLAEGHGGERETRPGRADRQVHRQPAQVQQPAATRHETRRAAQAALSQGAADRGQEGRARGGAEPHRPEADLLPHLRQRRRRQDEAQVLAQKERPVQKAAAQLRVQVHAVDRNLQLTRRRRVQLSLIPLHQHQVQVTRQERQTLQHG